MSREPAPPEARWFARLLRAYPAAFRARFGEGMHYAFLQDLEAARRTGRRAVVRLWLETLRSTAAGAVVARWPGLESPVHHAGPGTVRPRSLSMRSTLALDLRDAWRALRATPLISAVAVLSLALGIGANTAIFSMLDSLVLKTLPVHEPDRLVLLDDGAWTNPIWEAIRSRQPDLVDGAFAWSDTRFNLASKGEAELVDGLWASGAMFEVLGVAPILGRTFTPADDVRGGGTAGPVAVISYGFWQRRFGGAADVLGRTLTISRVPYTIVGVTPPSFFGPEVGRTFDVAVPIGTEPLQEGPDSALDRRSHWWLEIMARLRPDQTAESASKRLVGVQTNIRAETMPQDWQAEAQARYLETPLLFRAGATGTSGLRTRYQTPLTTLMAVVGLVLLIACGNIANLLLARGAARRHEFSVRLALGASRLRLTRQLLVESLLLAGIGGILGLCFARLTGPLLVRQLGSGQVPVTLDLAFDWRVLAFTAAVAALTAAIFGVAPALGAARVAPNDALKAQGRSVAGDRRTTVRQALVVTQVALSLTLVVAAGLFVQTFSRLATLDVGFDRDPILVVSAGLPAAEVPPPARLDLFLRLRDAAAAVPGVAGATASVITPVSGSAWNTVIEIPDGPELPERQRLPMLNHVLPDWFKTYGTPFVRGRDFDDRDRLGSPSVIVVNETFAQRFFPGVDPVGRVVREPAFEAGGLTKEYRIVGLVRDAVYRRLREAIPPTMYLPLRQFDEEHRSGVSITVRAASGSPALLTRGMAEALGRVAPTATLTFRRLSDDIDASLAQERLVAVLSGFFGALALLLAGLGLYGVTSFAVSQRRREIGVRLALGAKPQAVVALVLRRVAWLVGLGIVAGAALSFWAASFVGSLLFELSPRDPATFVLAATVLGVVGAAAGWLPARRAAQLDPARVLHDA